MADVVRSPPAYGDTEAPHPPFTKRKPFGATTGSIGLQWTIAAPVNDDFANARALTGTSGASPATTVRSTGEPGEPGYHGGAIADNSVWFAWTPTTSNPAVVRVLNPAGGLLPWMAVYTGSTIGGLTAVASGSASASFNAVANQRYLIAVDGAAGSTGVFTLEYVLGRCNGLSATLFAGAGTTTGTAGNDVIVGSTVANTINGGAGNDTICSLAGNDTLSGDAGNDRLFGGTGDDGFREGAASSGADIVAGDTGSDSVFYNTRSTPVNVTLDAIANDGAAGEGDLVTGAERIHGGSAADTMQGSVAGEMLRGNGGNDTLRGGAGGDTLIGHTGDDRLFGEAEADALDLIDGVGGNDRGDGGADTDTATLDAGDIVVNVP